MPIIVDHPDGLVTLRRGIRAQGLPAGAARLSACMEKPDGSFWCSHAVFEVDASGVLDLSRQAPLAGDWATADSMAPVWSMRQVRGASFPEKSAGVDPQAVLLCLRDAAGESHCARFVQHFMAPGVTCRDIDAPGLSGKVFHPAGPGPFPVVLALNGSNGGMPLQRAALFASSGYIAVALAFFGAPGRPKYFGDTDLEYFEQALQWIRLALRPRDGFVLVSGVSRGGELALLLASLFPELIQGCVAFVPSAVVNGIQQAGEPGRSRDEPAWRLGGVPLPNLWKGNPDADVSMYTTPEIPGMPIRQDNGFRKALANEEFREKSAIPVERINGPVLLISAGDDGCWPSELFCRMVENRLLEHGHPWPVEHLANPLAGHEIGFPFVPSRGVVSPHSVSGLVMDFGGEVEINMRASETNWRRVIEFMGDAPSLYGKGHGAGAPRDGAAG